jgi:hypothetical protein
VLVYNWLHSVGQNHFHVMLLFIRDSIIFRALFLEDSAQIPIQRNRIPCIRSDDMIFRPDDENFPSEPSFVSRSFELFQVESVRTSQQHVRTSFSVQPTMGFLSKTQIWKDNCNRPDDVRSRPDALLHKARRAYKVQPSGRHSSWSGCSNFIYGNCVHQFNRPDAPSLDMEIACR